MKEWVDLQATRWFLILDSLGSRIQRLNHQAIDSLDLPVSFLYEQTLFNFGNIQLEQEIHFLHNPFFIHPAKWNATPLFEQLSKKVVVCYF